MSTNFPGTGIDSYSAKVDNVDNYMASHINDLQDAVVALQTKVGKDESAVNTSLDYKLGAVKSGQKAVDVGDVKMILGASAPAGWLLMRGLTIGNAASNATARANADTATLFAKIWDEIANAEAPILDSAGAASSRGANAAADYAANKAITIPDAQRRVPVMYKSGDGDFGTLGKVGGFSTHTLTTAEIPSHTHIQDAHTHTGKLAWGTASSNRRYETGSGNLAGTETFSSSMDSTTATNQNAGGGGSHNNLQPFITLNFVIKY